MAQVTHGGKSSEATIAHDQSAAAAQPVWRVTNAPIASSRTDDIWFRDPLRGWAVNSNGQILHTEDGVVTFAEQFHDKDVYLRCVGFASDTRGWVVGGKSPTANPTRDNVRAVVLRTEDGGQTWVNTVAGLSAELPPGEWGWKIQFLDELVGFVALESFTRGAILKTVDGGDTWTRLEINYPQGNANLEGIGFLDENTGWVGGWGSASFRDGFSSATTDGGTTWHNANEIGAFINRFRFFHDPVTVGYASGRTVYRYAADPLPGPRHATAPAGLSFLADNTAGRSEAPLQIAITVPTGAEELTINIWDRFGAHVRRLLDEPRPTAGSRTVEWDGTDDAGTPLDEGSFLIRVSVDDRSESQIMYVTR